MKKILIAGCGYLGTALGGKLARAGCKVWGVRRDPAAAPVLKKANIEPLTGDLTDQKFLDALPSADYVLFCASPSRPSDNYEMTYLQAAKSLADHYWKDSLKKFIFISSTSVYSTTDGSWVDEVTDPLKPGHQDATAVSHAKILLDAEKAVLECAHPAVIFRLSGFYGPGRNRIRPILEGKFKPALSDELTNRIYVDDAVNGIQLLLEKGKPGEIYLGADDAPSTQREFYTWLYDQLKLPLPEGGTDRMPATKVRHQSASGFVHSALGDGFAEALWRTSAGRHRGGSNKKCWNGKIKKLGLKLQYPSYKEGYEELIRESRHPERAQRVEGSSGEADSSTRPAYGRTRSE